MRTLALRPSVLITSLIFVAACGHPQAEQATAQHASLRARVAAVETVSEGKPVEAYGVVQAARQAFVSSRLMGPVVAVRVQSGARVERGQPLLEIQPATSEGQVAQARGALAQAQAALTLAERNERRFAALHADRAVSDLELEMAQMQLEQARGAVQQAEGAVQAATTVADDAVVRAPYPARIVETLVEVGDLAAPGRPLVRLESFAGREIWLDVGAGDIRLVSIGDQVPVTLDSRPDLGRLSGTVSEVVPSADRATHTFTVKVDLGAIEAASGLSGRAWLRGASIERLVVPQSAIHERGGLELVVVAAPDSTTRTRAVTTGARLPDGRVEVLSGLANGDLVVVDAPGPVADGTPLEVVS